MSIYISRHICCLVCRPERELRQAPKRRPWETTWSEPPLPERGKHAVHEVMINSVYPLVYVTVWYWRTNSGFPWNGYGRSSGDIFLFLLHNSSRAWLTPEMTVFLLHRGKALVFLVTGLGLSMRETGFLFTLGYRIGVTRPDSTSPSPFNTVEKK